MIKYKTDEVKLLARCINAQGKCIKVLCFYTVPNTVNILERVTRYIKEDKLPISTIRIHVIDTRIMSTHVDIAI